MNTVWKYPIAPAESVELIVPEGAQLIHVDNQGPIEACLWFRVDDDRPMVTRRFAVRGTGHDCTNLGAHVGSFQLRGGALVFHLFEVP